MGLLDLFSGLLLFYTVVPVPETVSIAHSGFLIMKGSGTMLRPVKFPFPVFILGTFADIMSAGLLYFGNPPLFMEYQVWIAGGLFLKGVWSALGLMNI